MYDENLGIGSTSYRYEIKSKLAIPVMQSARSASQNPQLKFAIARQVKEDLYPPETCVGIQQILPLIPQLRKNNQCIKKGIYICQPYRQLWAR